MMSPIVPMEMRSSMLMPVFDRLEAVDRFYQTDGSYRHEVFQIYAGIFKFFGKVNHKPQIVLYELVARLFVPLRRKGDHFRLLLGSQGFGQSLRAADKGNYFFLPAAKVKQVFDKSEDFHDFSSFKSLFLIFFFFIPPKRS